MLASALVFAAAVAAAPAAIPPEELARFGIECLPREAIAKGDWKRANDEADAAKQAEDWPRYLAAQRRLAAMSCQAIDWYGLTLSLQRAGKHDLAFEAADRAFDRDPNSFDQLLDPEHGRLRGLLAAPGFRESRLGRRLAASESARAARLAAGKASLAALGDDGVSPPRRVVKDACPGECCRLGDWTMAEAQPTYAAAGATTADGMLPAGSSARALEGEVHVVAEPVLVGAPATDPNGDPVLRPGDLAFRLDDVSEGFTNFQVGDRIVMADATWLEARCLVITDKCWGDLLRPTRGSRADQHWWVKVRLATGREHWIRPQGRIEGRCGCC